jgi:adenylate cyclase
MLHLVEDVNGEPPPIPGTIRLTTLFIDLASFAALTSARGDEAGAHTLDRFSELVRRQTFEYDGKLVKQIGDAFMLVFTDAAQAIRFGLAVRDAAAVQHDFPAVRIGAHTGEVLYREGDYVGTNVNTAARVAALAQRGQFTVTASTCEAARSMNDVHCIALGRQHLKGLPDEIEVFDLQPID